MRSSRHFVHAFAFAIVFAITSRASAQTTTTSKDPTTTTTTTVTTPADEARPPLGIFPDHLVDPNMRRSWGALPSRFFVSTTIDVGYVYARPRVSVGYGRPFTSWIGFDANPLAQTSGIGAYGGVRFALPYVDLRVGSRYFYSFQHSYLPPNVTYTRLDLDVDTGTPAQVVTHEAELTANLPLGPGDFLLLGSASIVTGVPAGQYVFEETLRVIVKLPYVWRARTGYSIRFGSARQHSVGLVVEALDVPRRDDSITVRAGPVMRIVLSRRVEVRGSFVMAIKSPDTIGLVGGDFTELGVRYRWATE